MFLNMIGTVTAPIKGATTHCITIRYVSRCYDTVRDYVIQYFLISNIYTNITKENEGQKQSGTRAKTICALISELMGPT